MSKAVNVNLATSGAGDGLASVPALALLLQNLTSPVRIDHVALAAAFSSYTAPTDASAPVRIAIVVPPTTSAFIKTLKGVTGDTGIGATGAGWTSQWIVIPMGNAQVWGILGTGAENIDIYYF